MSSDDLKAYATSTTDFYDLLGVSHETSQHDLDRAFRRTALKYHPDKVGTDPVAKEKFHLAKIGHEILSEPTLKALYDNARTARDQKKRQNELFEGKRKTLKEELESRERGLKRRREEDESVNELRRLAEDGKRRRELRNEALIKELRDEQSPSPNNTTTKIPTTTPISPTTSTKTPSPDTPHRTNVRGPLATHPTDTGSPFRATAAG
ncbi:MAG: hypothetical protein Q9187_005838, partial [Circinaria calcarea]